MSIDTVEQELIEEFDFIGEDWNDRYAHIIEMGKSLPPFPASEQTDSNKIKGCQSSVWMLAEERDGKIYFKGDSDALIVKGLVALMIRVFSGQSPEEIMNTNLEFMNKIGLQSHLSPTRNNGLAAMVKQMKFYAIAFKSKMEQKHD